MRKLAALAVAAVLLASPVFAHPPVAAIAATPDGRADAECMQAIMRMQKGMMAAQDPNAGRMWAMMMIPHHQGAVDTARITLKYAKDTEIRRIAQRTLNGQMKDIAELRTWLARHGGSASRR